ncbi:MAG TPA: tetratricopeptide repeat protein [Caldimonas sp.]|nr:tetratricopeptide repeat protein [Caldimonas sp.]HEX2543018.1 tetratricopeptide repeat protein [Caldimonas sp.]
MIHDLEKARAAFMEGVTHFQAGRFGDAEKRFDEALGAAPERASILVNLGSARLQLGRPAEALDVLERAVAIAPGDADAWSYRGVALADLRRPEAAVASHARALEIDPDRALDLFHRALALNMLGRHAEALGDLEAVLELRPADAEAWFRHGQTLQFLDRHPEALASYERALAIDPGHAQAWSNRGGILRDVKRLDEAARSFEQAIAHGADAELHRYFLAAVRDEPAPAQAPAAHVEALFDHYARSFDEHLLEALRYDAHAVLVDGLVGLGSRWFSHALDLGCGTGLCGPLVRPYVERLDGVDLSAGMLERARATGAYRELIRSDLAEHLLRTGERHDLVLSADVFIYVGDLAGVFAGVRRVLQAGGLFCFSVELAAAEHAFELRPSLRYAHGEPYLRRLAEANGFLLRRRLGGPIRQEQGAPVEGLFMYLEKR